MTKRVGRYTLAEINCAARTLQAIAAISGTTHYNPGRSEQRTVYRALRVLEIGLEDLADKREAE